MEFNIRSNLSIIRNNIAKKQSGYDSKQSGYDLPVVGLDDNQFLSIHIPALVCIFCSLTAAIIVVTSSFCHQRGENRRGFFYWHKWERFVIYIGLCDGLFNAFHSMDHLQIAITRDHVYPKSLCIFYASTLLEFICAQLLVVNIVALNAFFLIFFGRDLKLGRYDWKLLVYMFGVSLLIVTVAASLDILGPSGMFCYFDGVKGRVYETFFVTLPILTIILLNICLYSLTWYKIRHVESTSIVRRRSSIVCNSHRAAKKMIMFVFMFFIQWIPVAVFSVWHSVNADVPILLIQFATTFSNIGGVLNAMVYFYIRRQLKAELNSRNT